jgi:hypothetical protein
VGLQKLQETETFGNATVPLDVIALQKRMVRDARLGYHYRGVEGCGAIGVGRNTCRLSCQFERRREITF